MRNYSSNGLRKNSFANAKNKKVWQARYIGNTGLGVYRNPEKAYAAVAAIQNIIAQHFSSGKRRPRGRNYGKPSKGWSSMTHQKLLTGPGPRRTTGGRKRSGPPLLSNKVKGWRY